jgi:hypothetical protein
LRDQHHLLRRLDELRGRDGVCFCAPEACHLDLVVRSGQRHAGRTHRVVALRGGYRRSVGRQA